MNRVQVADRCFGYDGLDASDNKIGSVNDAWVDHATDALKFIGVKTDWPLGKMHIVPIANAQDNDASQRHNVPYLEDQIKDAPDVGTVEVRTGLHEEERQLDKRPVEAGRPYLRKVVRTERAELPVVLRREDVETETRRVGDEATGRCRSRP